MKRPIYALAMLVATTLPAAANECQPNSNVVHLRVGIENPSGNVQLRVHTQPCNGRGRWMDAGVSSNYCFSPGRAEVSPLEKFASIIPLTGYASRMVVPALTGAYTSLWSVPIGTTCTVGQVAPVGCAAMLAVGGGLAGGTFLAADRAATRRNLENLLKRISEGHQAQEEHLSPVTFYRFDIISPSNLAIRQISRREEMDHLHSFITEQFTDLVSDLSLQNNGHFEGCTREAGRPRPQSN